MTNIFKAYFRSFKNLRETGNKTGERRLLVDDKPDLTECIAAAKKEFVIPEFDSEEDVKEYTIGKTGDFQTINDALNEAEDGSRLYLEPGKYVESLNPYKSFELIGPEEGEALILAEPDGTALVSEAPVFYIKNITLINKSGPWYTAYTRCGWLIMDSCIIEGIGAGAGAMESSGAYIKNCIFRNCEGAAMYVQGESDMLAVDNEIIDCVYGATVEYSSAYILGCKIRNCPRGVYIENGRHNNVIGCEIVGCSEIAVTVLKNEKFLMKECSISTSGRDGLVLEEAPECKVIGNEILRSKEDGIMLDGNSNADIIDNRIEQSNRHGIWCGFGSKGVIKNNRIKDCGFSAIKLIEEHFWKVVK